MKGFETVDAAMPAEDMLSEGSELVATATERNGETIVTLRRPGGGKLKKRKWTAQSFLALFLALLPMIGFLLFSTAPLIISLIALFCDVSIDWQGISFSWNGFNGFRMIFEKDFGMGTQFARDFSSVFWKSLGITLWLGSTQFITLLIALGL